MSPYRVPAEREREPSGYRLDLGETVNTVSWVAVWALVVAAVYSLTLHGCA